MKYNPRGRAYRSSIKYFEDNNEKILNIQDKILNFHSRDLKNIFDIHEGYHNMNMRVYIFYDFPPSNDSIDPITIVLCELDEYLTPNIPNKRIVFNYLFKNEIDMDLLGVKIELSYPRKITKVRDLEIFADNVNDFMVEIKSHCNLDIFRESHKGYDANPDIYLRYEYYLQFK